MIEKKCARSFGTHDGTFHADEVTACALLLLCDLIDRSKINRTRDRKLLDHCEFVCDVGGVYDRSKKLFDHHQAEYTGPLSSAGMVLDYLRFQKIITEGEYAFFNHSLILGVDAHDNGKTPQLFGYQTYSDIIANFLPVKYDATAKEEDFGFSEALDFAYRHLKKMLERYHYTQSCRDVVQKAMESGSDFLIFDHGIPWLELFFQLGGISHPAQFVIMPSGGAWNLRCIPPSLEEKMKMRLPLPLEWAGLLEGELNRVSGIPGAIFCHKGRFISVWESKDDAIKALDFVLQKVKK